MRGRFPILSPRQRGVALFVVIVFVLLSMLLALWASRTALFGEMVTGNDADHQRAFEAAQALLQDAELDIRGENADGTPCSRDAGESGDRCRAGIPQQIPLEAQEVGRLLASLGAKSAPCSNGLCVKRVGPQDFWNNADPRKGTTLARMTGTNNDQSPVGARYGQYTGAPLGSPQSPANPILADRNAATRGGWYWIEVLLYDESSRNSGLIVADDSAGNATVANSYLPLNLLPNVVYRITAVAYGLKAHTQVVLQQTYARQKLRD